MRIAVDMDGTIADLIGYFVETFERADGKIIVREDVIEYDLEKTWPGALKRFEKRFSPFEWLKPIDGMAKAMAKMIKDHDVFIVSSALSKPWIMKEKIRWIERELPFFDTQKVIFTNDKSIFSSDWVLIDDNPKFINNFQGIRVVFDAPYNRGSDVRQDARITSWSEWPDLDLEELAKRQR